MANRSVIRRQLKQPGLQKQTYCSVPQSHCSIPKTLCSIPQTHCSLPQTYTVLANRREQKWALVFRHNAFSTTWQTTSSGVLGSKTVLHGLSDRRGWICPVAKDSLTAFCTLGKGQNETIRVILGSYQGYTHWEHAVLVRPPNPTSTPIHHPHPGHCNLEGKKMNKIFFLNCSNTDQSGHCCTCHHITGNELATIRWSQDLKITSCFSVDLQQQDYNSFLHLPCRRPCTVDRTLNSNY